MAELARPCANLGQLRHRDRAARRDCRLRVLPTLGHDTCDRGRRMRVHAGWVLIATLVALRCGGNSVSMSPDEAIGDSGGAGGGAGGPTQSAAGRQIDAAAGSAGTGPTGTGCQNDGPRETSPVIGSGFDDWEGTSVQVKCSGDGLRPVATVIMGRFSFTFPRCINDTFCTVVISRPGRVIGCLGPPSTVPITPASCWCNSGFEGSPGIAGGPGVGCEAGTEAGAKEDAEMEAGRSEAEPADEGGPSDAAPGERGD
jgi:hypothetical protein